MRSPYLLGVQSVTLGRPGGFVLSEPLVAGRARPLGRWGKVSSAVMGVWGVVVAGGSGRRYGALKQLEMLDDRLVLDWAVDALVRAGVDGVVLVVPGDATDRSDLPGDVIVPGGSSRSASVRAGLAAVPAGIERVLVHDGARPLASPELVRRVLAGLDRAPAVVPVVPVTDTLRRTDGGVVDRSDVVAVQTPQGFDRGVLARAHDAGRDATDDAALVDALGETVLHVDGEATNIKITRPVDLAVAKVLLTAIAEEGNTDDAP